MEFPERYEEVPEREALEPETIQLICQLNKVTTTKDGGGRLILDFGAESLKGIQRLQTLNSTGEVSLALAIVPYRESF